MSDDIKRSRSRDSFVGRLQHRSFDLEQLAPDLTAEIEHAVAAPRPLTSKPLRAASAGGTARGLLAQPSVLGTAHRPGGPAIDVAQLPSAPAWVATAFWRGLRPGPHGDVVVVVRPGEPIPDNVVRHVPANVRRRQS